MSANPAQLGETTGSNVAEDDRRDSNRQLLGAVGVLAEETDQQFANQLQVLVMDVSLSGVGFRAPVPFRNGSIYAMKIGTGPLHLKARLEIVSSRPREDGTFDVGAKFV